MLDDPFKYGLLAALAIALLIAAFTDFRSRQIGNWLNGAIALGAPLFWWANDLTLWPGVAMQLGQTLATYAVFEGLFAVLGLRALYRLAPNLFGIEGREHPVLRAARMKGVPLPRAWEPPKARVRRAIELGSGTVPPVQGD